jgi:hypothetical protein
MYTTPWKQRRRSTHSTCVSECQKRISRLVLTMIGIPPKHFKPAELLFEVLIHSLSTWTHLLLSLSFGHEENIDSIMNTVRDLSKGYELASPAACNNSVGVESEDLYILSELTLLSLRYIGLDVHGGRERLASIMLDCKRMERYFPASLIIVIDRQKASEYFDFGVQIEANLLHRGHKHWTRQSKHTPRSRIWCPIVPSAARKT